MLTIEIAVWPIIFSEFALAIAFLLVPPKEAANAGREKLRGRAAAAREDEVAEVAEVRESARHEAVAMGLLADRAVGLLRRATMQTSDDELKAQVNAFLSEQAGERENGDG